MRILILIVALHPKARSYLSMEYAPLRRKG